MDCRGLRGRPSDSPRCLTPLDGDHPGDSCVFPHAAEVRSLIKQNARLIAALVILGLVALAWLAVAHPLDLTPAGQQVHSLPEWAILKDDIGGTYSWFLQMVGVLGWLDTYFPTPVYLFWMVAVGSLFLIAIASVRNRKSIIPLFALIVLVLVVPVLIELSQARRVGLVWQGRYTLPIAVGIPILSSAIIGVSDLPRTFRRTIATLIDRWHCAVSALCLR